MKKRIGYKIWLSIFLVIAIIGPVPNPASADPVISGGNLLVNPDFELADSSGNAAQWDRTGNASFSLVNTNVSNGYKAQKIQAANIPSGQFISISQVVPVTGNHSYLLSGRIHIEQLSGAAVQLYVDFYNGNRFISANSWTMPNETTTDYVTISGENRIPANATSARVYALIRSSSSNGSGTIEVDAMRFVPTGEQGQSLLANSGFESDTPTSKPLNDWSVIQSGSSQITTVASQYENGDAKQEVRMTASSLPINQFTAIYQKVRTVPGQKFNVSAVLNVTSLTDAKVYLYADFFNGANYIQSAIYELADPTLGSSVTLSGYGDVPANASSIVLYIMIKSTAANGAGTVNVDQVNLQDAPEGNLLANGSFQAGTPSNVAANWQASQTSGTAAYAFTESNNGIAQKIKVTGLASGTFSGISQLLKVQPSQTYSVSGRVNVESLTNAKAQLYADFYSSDFSQAGAASIDLPVLTGNQYMTIASPFTVPANAAYMRVYILVRATGSNGSGNIQADDFRCSLTTNLLSNPSFESNLSAGIAANWSEAKQSAGIAGYSSIASAPYPVNTRLYDYTPTGASKKISLYKNGLSYQTFFKYDSNGNMVSKISRQSAFLNQPVNHEKQSQRVSGLWIPNGQFYSVYQSIVVKPNQAYRLTSDINVELLYNAKVQIYIDFLNAAGGIAGSAIQDYTGVQGQYTTQQINGIVPGNAVTATIHYLIRATGGNGGGIFYVDNTSFSYTAI